MIPSKTRWSEPEWTEDREQAASSLSKLLSIPPIVARLLVGRGIETADEAEAFLKGGAELLHDPYELHGMDAAVERIRQAITDGERIRIYGDYDADGVSSTSLMIHLLQRLGANFDYYIPHRTREGYGMNNGAVDLAAQAGVKLFITVDTGISAVDEVAYANELGIDVVVTDHHEPPDILPDAYAIINPKQEACTYPYSSLAGVGVAFKLATALLGEPPIDLTDIVALGTIADVMPLTGENRILVKLGLETMAANTRPGFRSLAEIAGFDIHKVTSTNVAFAMAPRINASGRLDHANGAVELLTASDRESADVMAARLDTLNRERQGIVEVIVEQAKQQWADKCQAAAEADLPEPSVIVVAGEGWNAGVIGIVASKLLDKHYKPTVVLGIDPETGMCKGSARSIDRFDLHAALNECAELFDHFGGHQAAAGMSLHRDRLEAFEASLIQSANAWLTSEDWIPKTAVDICCAASDVSLETIDHLGLLEPFGVGNPAPRFLLAAQPVADKRTMGKDHRHLRLTVGTGMKLEAVGFGFGELAERMAHGAFVDLVGELAVNEWNGNRKPQLFIQDLRVEKVQLFDWRDEREPYAALRRLLETASRGSRRTIVLTSEDAVRETAAACARTDAVSEHYYIGHYEDTLSDSLPFVEAIVYGLPPSADALQLMIANKLGKLQSVHLLYAKRQNDRGDRTGKTSFPERKDFGAAYQLLRRLGQAPERGLNERIAQQIGWPPSVVSMMLDVFEELAFIARNSGVVTVAETPSKADLSTSQAYNKAKRQSENNGILFASTEQLYNFITRGS
ncbi:single-stranded-DNA-specific exonuclease RecJ [Paenibacillus sp. PR3]|uniref:Single-stranded-DNA-specific exonuclease RecJ n=1 Tax=Paenibacillus terricola TaxID=2763503 RepID=A0ABR8MS14_9BACL|nr:single-stranded-DNA-specific exonuclease RecJ [Paenibacillus terricola]MBD3917796.1 single-stranded-DNA-specific exonuclease RecJ [Paenibacillus terricola]